MYNFKTPKADMYCKKLSLNMKPEEHEKMSKLAKEKGMNFCQCARYCINRVFEANERRKGKLNYEVDRFYQTDETV